MSQIVSACNALEISEDSKICYNCCSDGYIAVWDMHNQTLITQLKGHLDEVTCINISGDNNKLWTGSLDNTVRSWDLRERRQLHHHKLNNSILCMDLNPIHRDCLVAGMNNANIVMLQGQNDESRILKTHENLLKIQYSSDGKYVISAGKGLITGTTIHKKTIFNHCIQDIQCLDFNKDTNIIAAG